MDAADLLPNEKVIVDNNNGNRLETYVIEGERFRRDRTQRCCRSTGLPGR